MLTSRRIISLTVVAVALLTTLSSCASVSKDAIRFNSESLPAHDFEDLLVGFSQAVPSALSASGNITSVTAQAILQDWISTQAILTALKDAGVEISDENRTTALNGLQQAKGFSDSPQGVQDFYVLAASAQAAASAAFALGDEEIKKIYDQGAIRSGAVCLRAILTETQEQMDLVSALLSAGQDFAATAEKFSIDKTGANGGVINDAASGSQCISQAIYESQFSPDFQNALADVPVGGLSVPFEIPKAGWVILLIRPYDEVSADLPALIAGNALTDVTNPILQGAKIWVNPQYGRWDLESQSIVPLS
ncbi:MAG: peptidylprolyl isomerase [Actinomycetes bacterium]